MGSTSADAAAQAVDSDADQTLSDADQTAADEDTSALEQDQASSEQDQELSDRDQATADREDAEGHSPRDDEAFRESRADRAEVSDQRDATHMQRERRGQRRSSTNQSRDAVAVRRDERAALRDAEAALVELAIARVDPALARKLQDLRQQATADRAEAARDRARAARDRAANDRHRARLEAELMQAHIDELTGTYRRAMGRTALAQEIDRARRGDGQFVVAFVDVDGLKDINDRDGHHAGDLALKAVASAVRRRLRSFDPVLRYGGDEFVAGMGGVAIEEAQQRFDLIAQALRSDHGISISVGVASLAPGESVDELIERADGALTRQRRHHRIGNEAEGSG